MSRRSTRRPIERRPRTQSTAVHAAAAARKVDTSSEGSDPSTQTFALDHSLRIVAGLVGGWAPTAARMLLGLVLAWFGYHELIQPGLWTGYVPVLSPHSGLSDVLVLAHGWVLFVLAAALVVGFAVRISSAIAALLLLEIVISLIVSGGLSDLVLRDVGVLGLACSLVGNATQRLAIAA
ncbi:MAG TPA: hypothetical protein VKR27_03980 [Acidimicrobiales bacterium]|nr:hypothetical protein [Acidimicrobiales bacterium]